MFKSKGETKKFYFSQWQYDQATKSIKYYGYQPSRNHVFIDGKWKRYTACMGDGKTIEEVCPEITDSNYLGETGGWDIAINSTIQNKSITVPLTDAEADND